ncbi:hypothetical protein DSAG12_00169 [Promethearchaeum syntrophicum]|uniref:Uncharacterized protein n=1 Tax=Promethearchaeum syntrophicum TaxID=2594042 RepID=A0A5B9D5V3_9ARCH|nr:hypothetical protein [Candidatus Prometheoarchaeum syntrophicum]QEE14356.1 hypothetical protein DSAG12_00169 [Candidatus Prometheoarchaeum syntrophicum]
MTLDWTFSFVKINPNLKNKPVIELLCTFHNGRTQIVAYQNINPNPIKQMENVMMLLSYIAFFPQKDFNKIKLETSGNKHAVHFLDKRFLLKDGFLGILSVSEYDTPNIYSGPGTEEMMAEYIFDYYFDLRKEGPIDIPEFQKWIESQILDFYIDWADSKKEFIAESQGKNIEIKKTQEIFEEWRDLQLINEYGQPLTDLISFINDKSFLFYSESEAIAQNLESMSLSALKLLIDQQGGWDIRYLKMRQRNLMGFQYVFFEKFEIRGTKYLLIMNSALYDIKKGVCLQAFRGDEIGILENISNKLQQNSSFFMENGQIVREYKEAIQEVIFKNYGSSH